MVQGYIQRADQLRLREVFSKYASVSEGGELFLTYEDFLVNFLGLLPEQFYNRETLDLYGGVLDLGKDGSGLISFKEFAVFEAHLCRPDALYRATFQLFDRDSGGSVGFPEFMAIMQHSTHHREIPFEMDGSFVQLYFGRDKERSVPYREFCQLLHDYNTRYSKYAFKAFDSEGCGLISSNDFCKLLITLKNHLMTSNVKRVLKDFVLDTQGSKVNYAYSTAFQALLGDMETAKKVYLCASGGSKTKEISKDVFLHSSMTMDRLNPMQVDILFFLSQRLHDSPTIIYSDLQSLAPEQYMKQVTQRLVDVKLVERPEDRNWLIVLLEFCYRFSIGSVSGIAGAAAVYPVDLVKTRMMNQRTQTTGVKLQAVYADTMDCFYKVVHYEGLAGLYRGMGLQLAYVATGKATKLATNDYVRDKLSASGHGHIPLLGEVMAGAAAGLSNVLFSNPLELLKIRLQCAGQYPETSMETATSLYRQLGPRCLTTGLAACVLRDVPFSALYFPSYAHLKAGLADDTGYNSLTSIFLAGAIAGAPAAFLVTPMDMIKTRLQVVARSGETCYNGVLDAAAKIYREEGWRAFWKGGIARKMRSSPQFGITLVAYELVQRMLFVDFGGTSPTGSLRETTPGVAVSSNRDHVGGYAVARPVFQGMESKFGLVFPKYESVSIQI